MGRVDGPTEAAVKRCPRIETNSIVNRLLLVRRENMVSVTPADRLQLTQHQIGGRWMGPDGPVILTKDCTASVLRQEECFFNRDLCNNNNNQKKILKKRKRTKEILQKMEMSKPWFKYGFQQLIMCFRYKYMLYFHHNDVC